jgi:hypothetical protein
MKLITKIEVHQADHTEVIDQAATQVGTLASKAALAFFNRAAQDAQQIIGYGGQARAIVDVKVVAYRETQIKPVLAEAKGGAIALLDHSKNRAQVYFQGLLQEHVTHPLDSRWEVHRQQVEGLRGWVAQFTSEIPIEEATPTEAESEDLAPNTTGNADHSQPIAEVGEPVDEGDEFSIQVLDPPVDDPLEDEMAIPEDPAPVPATAKRRTTRKATASIADLIKEEAGKV